MQIIETADEFVPVVKVAVEKSNNLLSELRPLLDNFIDYLSDSKIKMVNKYVDNGFTKDEAILIYFFYFLLYTYNKIFNFIMIQYLKFN